MKIFVFCGKRKFTKKKTGFIFQLFLGQPENTEIFLQRAKLTLN